VRQSLPLSILFFVVTPSLSFTHEREVIIGYRLGKDIRMFVNKRPRRISSYSGRGRMSFEPLSWTDPISRDDGALEPRDDDPSPPPSSASAEPLPQLRTSGEEPGEEGDRPGTPLIRAS
jgi:hypothetical protein